MEGQPSVRSNGFEWPFHPLQVLSWGVFGLDVSAYCIFIFPLIGHFFAQTCIALCYAASVIVMVCATVVATRCDPADPHMRPHGDTELEMEEESMRFCTICDVPVYPRSKHCRACNKCVNVFDHHCMWLNNCIGHENYRAFAVTIASVAAMLGVVLGSCVYLLVDYFIDGGDEFERRLNSIIFLRHFPKEVFLGILVAMCAVNVPLLLLDMQLVMLHAFLSWQKLTTYEYIMSKREMGVEREACAEASKNLRQQITTLPRCMDWIVFVRPKKNGRGQKKTDIERIDAPESSEATSGAGAWGRDPEVKESPEGAAPGTVNDSRTSSPPGSTTAATVEAQEAADEMVVDSQVVPKEPPLNLQL